MPKAGGAVHGFAACGEFISIAKVNTTQKEHLQSNALQ